MKTIYKVKETEQPNEIERIHKLNSTGSLWRQEGTNYDLIFSYNTPIAYVQDVNTGFLNETKVVLCNYFYSMTTRKHQAWIRERYSLVASIGEFELGAYFKRAKIDGVDVSGGAHR